MPTINVPLQRFSVISPHPFDDVLAALTATIGRADPGAFRGAKTASDLAAAVQNAIGASGFLEFTRFDAGEILRKEQGTQAPKIVRLVVGNPLIMKEMVKHIPDAASYAPVTLLIDERSDGVHLSYDLMASLLAPYGNDAALRVAEDLDRKVKTLLEAAARGAQTLHATLSQ